jgi:hypothetical protein
MTTYLPLQTSAPETLIRNTKAGAAQCVALSSDHVISGWADGTLRCHARGTPAPGRELWAIPNAHLQAHSCGVTAVNVSHRWVLDLGGWVDWVNW